MIINPIIPVWIMGIICILLLFFKRKGVFAYVRQILTIALMFVINLRIMVPGKDVADFTSGVDVLFVVDNTISMLAEDYQGSDRRMDAVKEDCKYIMEQFPGASFSVITFGNTVERVVPYTVDADMAIQAIEVLKGQTEYYANGTSLNEVMSTMDDILKNERENFQIVFFISDGEVVNSKKLKSYSDLKEYVDGGAVLGYGTKKGGAMRPLKYTGDEDTPEYLYYYDDDFNKVKAISKIDEGNLKQIASDFGVDYVHMTKQSEVQDEIKKIKASFGKQEGYVENGSKKGFTETYYFFTIPLVLLLLFDAVSFKRKV